MTIATITGEEFEQDTAGAKMATADGPVFITDGGEPAYVLLSIEEYQRRTGGRRNIVEALSMPGLSEIEVDFLRSRALPRLHDLS